MIFLVSSVPTLRGFSVAFWTLHLQRWTFRYPPWDLDMDWRLRSWYPPLGAHPQCGSTISDHLFSCFSCASELNCYARRPRLLFFPSAGLTSCIPLVRWALALQANSLPSVYQYKLRDLDFCQKNVPRFWLTKNHCISHTLLFALKPGNAHVTHLGELEIIWIITINIILIRLCACSRNWAKCIGTNQILIQIVLPQSQLPLFLSWNFLEPWNPIRRYSLLSFC